MSKKIFFILVLLFVVFSLSACMESPGIKDSALPSDFLMRKAVENGEIESPEVEKFEIPTSLTVGIPTGDYILLASIYGTDEFILSFYNDGKKICSWENGTTNPLLFEEKRTIYIAEPNCPGMGELVISWDLSQNISTVPVWSIIGSQYFLLD